MKNIITKVLFVSLLFTTFLLQGAVKIAPDSRLQYMDSNGDPCSGCLLYTYVAGSTTNQSTFTDSTGGVANSNPITLNGSGYTPNGLWLTEGQSYKFVLKTAADVTVWSEDNVDGVNDASLTIDEWLSTGLTPTFVSTTQFTLTGDQTTEFHVGRRLKTTDSGGDDYCTISTSAYTSLTTVTVACDSSGVLDSGLSIVSYGIASADNLSLPYVVKNNFAATVAPTVTDDSTSMYSEGSMWVDVTNDLSYVNVDSSASAAVWQSIASSEVGDIVQSMRTSKTGWLLLDGDTIGSASSGATHASADYDDLYTLLWTNCANTECAVSTGRGASAAADLAANKTLTLPDASGRTLRGKDDMSGSSAGINTHAQGDLLGGVEGSETHTLTKAEIPPHVHTYTQQTVNAMIGTGPNAPHSNSTQNTGDGSADGLNGDAHENMSPYLTINTFIKY